MINVKLPDSLATYLDKRRKGIIGLPNWWYALKRRVGKVWYFFKNVYRRIRFHWFTPHRVITVRSLSLTEYRDIDTLLFETTMQLLVNFVETEKAHMTRICSVRHYNRYLKGEVKWEDLDEFTKRPCIVEYINVGKFDKWWNETKWNEILGQNYLEWEVSLKDTPTEYEGEHTAHLSQSDTAAEVLRIYRWYKFERPLRSDPWDGTFDEPKYAYEHENGGQTNDMMEEKQTDDHMFTMRKLTSEYAEYLKKCSDLEEKYDNEDTQNAMKIIEIRRHLWT